MENKWGKEKGEDKESDTQIKKEDNHPPCGSSGIPLISSSSGLLSGDERCGGGCFKTYG